MQTDSDEIKAVGVGVKHIVVATDFSEEGQRAVEFAVVLAKPAGATVTMVHVAAEAGRDFTDAHDRLEAQSLRLKRLHGASTQIATAIGLPASRLIGLCRDRQADLVVIAASSKTTLQKWLLGSTATQLLRRSPVPVLVVGPGMRPEINSIVVGCAYTSQCAAAYRAADQIGAAFGASIEVVHVSSDPGEVEIMAGTEGVRSQRTEEIKLASWCARELPDPRCKLVARHLVSEGPGRTLADHATSMGADLIALGSHDRGFLSRVRNPVTGEVVLENVYCGLLSVRVPTPTLV